jgi:hypothetical protein
MKRFCLLLLIFFSQVSFAQHLIKDVTNESTLDYNGSIFNLHGVKLNGRFYFVAQSLQDQYSARWW